MNVVRFTSELIDEVYDIQRRAYAPLYHKYHDDGNPYLESKETVFAKYTNALTEGYVFFENDIPVGAVRVIQRGDTCKISALAVLPDYQGRKIAQTALPEIEKLYPNVRRWKLDTLLQEAGNCHLYEKLGYVRTGVPTVINDKLTLVGYEKRKD